MSSILLFPIGFLLGVWYTAMLVLPLFYGIPRALAGYFRRQLRFKAVTAYLAAPALWTVFFVVIFFLMAYFWESGFNYLCYSGGFNWGQTLGSLLLILNTLFNRKSRVDMRADFDEFVKPYKLTK